MRRIVIVFAFALVAAASVPVYAGVHTDSVAFQGRLTDPADSPVADDVRDMTFSIWTDSIDGSQLWSETQAVTTHSGLFTVCIGCGSPSSLDDFAYDEVWLQVQLAGEVPMSPRTRMRAAPRAMVAGRVKGDISTSPNSLAVGDLDGDGRADLLVNPDTTGITLQSTSLFKSRSGHILILDDRAEATLRVYQPGQPEYGNITFSAQPGQVTDWRDADSDNDGVIDSRMSLSLGHGGGGAGGSLHIEADAENDGVPDNTIDQDCDGIQAQMRLAHEAAHVVQQSAGASGASLRIASDHDQDGLEDRRITQDCDDTDASISIDEPGVHVAITTNPDSTVFDNVRYLSDHNIIHRDLAARNILLSSRSRQTDTDTASIDMQIDSSEGGRGRLAIKTKGTGAQRVLASASSAGASIETGDDDCDGIMSSTSGTARLAIKTKGTSAKRVSAVASADSASIAIDEPGVHIAMRNKGWDGTIKGNLRITDGTDLKVDFDGDGDGYVASRFGIGVLDPANPLEHSSGAHLTAGGVWTNASDENLKENFQTVNGEELLGKIEQLPISEWNYKAESDEVKHIGPTAQDFQQTFGVGSDGKSISTIDPSGIALAAIKELNKQNQALQAQGRDLQDQNEQLKKQLADIQRKVELLLSRK